MTNVSVRLSDPDSTAALERGKKLHGSQSEAVRQAIRSTFGGGEDRAPVDDDRGLSETEREGYRILLSEVGIGNRMDIVSVRSVVADELNTPRATVDRNVIRPLERQDLIAVDWSMSQVDVVVIA